MQTFDALKFLRSIMSIDSQTRNFAGVNAVQNMISELLTGWGFKVEQISHPGNNSGNLLVAEKETDSHHPWINFIGHADTVLSSFPIEIGPVIWKGSGIADNKGGVVTLLQTIWNLRNKDLPFNYRIIISPNEETGSPGFHANFKYWGESAFLNLGFEPALENDELIESRNGNRWYEVKLESLSAHAGRAPKGRMNLIHRISDFIQNLENKTEHDPKLKFNVTSIQTQNQKFNVIPDSVTFKMDVRFNSFKQRDYFHALIQEELKQLQKTCLISSAQTEASLTIEDDCPPMGASSEMDLSSIPYCMIHSGGAADINYYSNPNNYSIDGWGGRGAQLHSKEEWLDTHSIFERAKVLSLWLENIKKTEIRNKPDSVLNYHSSRL